MSSETEYESNVIREATFDDIDQLARLYIASYSQNPQGGARAAALDFAETTAHMGRLVSSQSQTFKFWVSVTIAGQIVGYSTTQPTYPSPDPKYRNGFGLISTYIAPVAMGKGLGTKLVDHNLNYCRTQTDLAYIVGYRAPSNDRSVKITDQFGFETIGKLPARSDFPLNDFIVLSL